jgi:2-polyprenyl-3-methyl-5-hydroxy-6-metoxy-1,4-benzoquinol methylase
LKVSVTDWDALAREADERELRERILTGYRAGKPFTPYVPTIALPSPLARALDFGCGLGRNFPYLTSIAAGVTAYDLPPMIERCRALADHRGVRLSADWPALRTERFELIFCALVLQHVPVDACAAAVADFARMAPCVYLLTRGASDFGTNVLAAIAASALFDAGPCVEVDHDPATHQLRVLGVRPLDACLAPSDMSHYEVLLRSRYNPRP